VRDNIPHSDNRPENQGREIAVWLFHQRFLPLLRESQFPLNRANCAIGPWRSFLGLTTGKNPEYCERPAACPANIRQTSTA